MKLSIGTFLCKIGLGQIIWGPGKFFSSIIVREYSSQKQIPALNRAIKIRTNSLKTKHKFNFVSLNFWLD